MPGCHFKRVLREGFSERVTFEQRPQEDEGMQGGALHRPCLQGPYGSGAPCCFWAMLGQAVCGPISSGAYLAVLPPRCLPTKPTGSRAWELQLLPHLHCLPQIPDRGKIPKKFEIFK